MPDHDHAHFMQLAIDEGHKGVAEGNRPIGSVIIREGEVIGLGRNTVNSEGDPTNHAETVAIREACRALGVTELPGTTLYTTMEPCPMCLWAICLCGIERLVLGARHEAFQPPAHGEYSVERLLALTDRKIDLVTDVLRPECEQLRRG